jgi:hypothetical protein
MRRLSISAMLGVGFCLASISSLSIAAQDVPKPAAKHEAQNQISPEFGIQAEVPP